VKVGSRLDKYAVESGHLGTNDGTKTRAAGYWLLVRGGWLLLAVEDRW